MMFGSTVMRKGKLIALKLNWDHFVPYAYSGSNPGDNWIAACHVCNGIKGANVFASMEEARQFVSERREGRVHPVRPRTPVTASA